MSQIVVGLPLLSYAMGGVAAQPGTLRVDILHSGVALTEMYSLSEVIDLYSGGAH